jgi:hypothetical protein
MKPRRSIWLRALGLISTVWKPRLSRGAQAVEGEAWVSFCPSSIVVSRTRQPKEELLLTRPAILAFALILLAAPCCSGTCADGPTYIETAAVTAVVGQAFSKDIPANPNNLPGFTPKFIDSSGAPPGVSAAIAGDQLHLSGTAEVGSYQFNVLLLQERNNACASWARYEVTLTVAAH